MTDHNKTASAGKERSLIELAWPIFVNNVFNILLQYIDIFVISRINDLAAASISAAVQVMGIFYLILSVVQSAAGIMVTQYIGSGNSEKTRSTSGVCILFNTLCGIISACVILIFHRQLLIILGAEGTLLEQADIYLFIMGFGVLLSSFSGILSRLVFCYGETRAIMRISVSMGALNVALDALLVLGLAGLPAMGVRGAAYATLLTQLITVALVSWYYFTKIDSFAVFSGIRKDSFSELKTILHLGIPSTFDSVNYSLTQLVITGLILHSLGDTDIIARTYLVSIASVFQLFMNAISSATQILVGYAAGREDYESVKKECSHSMKLTLLLTGLSCILGVMFSDQLFGIFTDNPDVIKLGFSLMIVNVAVELGRVVNVIYIWSLRACGDVSLPVYISAACMWAVAVFGTLLILKFTHTGIVGVWAIAALDEWIRACIMNRRWKSNKWQEKRIA